MEEKKVLLLKEKDKQAPTVESSSDGVGGDDLDAFMSGLTSQLGTFSIFGTCTSNALIPDCQERGSLAVVATRYKRLPVETRLMISSRGHGHLLPLHPI